MKFKFVISTLLPIMLLTGCGSAPTNNDVTEATAAITEAQTEVTTTAITEASIETSNIDYEIIGTDDTSMGSVIRKDLKILINNPNNITQEDFQNVCKVIVEDYIASTPVNALTLYFVDDANNTSSGYTLGMCTYYPNGNIGDAMDVKTGDYSTFKYTYTFGDNIIKESATSNIAENSNKIVASEDVIEQIKSAFIGNIGRGVVIKDVFFNNKDLNISVDLSGVDYSKMSDTTPEDYAEFEIDRITAVILGLNIDDLWDTVTVDFGEIGYIKNSKSNIINEDDVRYFSDTPLQK